MENAIIIDGDTINYLDFSTAEHKKAQTLIPQSFEEKLFDPVKSKWYFRLYKIYYMKDFDPEEESQMYSIFKDELQSINRRTREEDSFKIESLFDADDSILSKYKDQLALKEFLLTKTNWLEQIHEKVELKFSDLGLASQFDFLDDSLWNKGIWIREYVKRRFSSVLNLWNKKSSFRQEVK